jgi:2-polyprenyl-3-methyl-5-hydroxy-6-metoxy-1,4-benzoquinol methylase
MEPTKNEMCSICAHKTEIIFSTKDYRRPNAPEVYSVCWCRNCQYGRVDGEFLPHQIEEFYRVQYYTHVDGSSHSDRVVSKESFSARLRTHLAWRMDRGRDFTPAEIEKNGTILDVGCGAGLNMKRLKEAGFEPTGVEPDPQARHVAKQYGEVHAGTAEDLPQEILAKKFDYALMSHVLEHTISPTQSLEAVHRVLPKGGRLIVEVPNCEARGFSEFGAFWPWTDVPRHLHFFTRQSLTQFLTKAGFSISTCFYTGFTRQFELAWINSLNDIYSILQPSSREKSSFSRQSWPLLARTAFASASRKYDSIRLHATRL